MTRKQTTIATAALLIAAILAFIVAGTSTTAPGDGQGQRSGLVATARTFEDTHTYYDSGAGYVQAVYASQGIEISTDLDADTYSPAVPARGDVVIGNGYVGVLVDDTTAIGVDDDGGPVQTYRVTTEDIRRVDW